MIKLQGDAEIARKFSALPVRLRESLHDTLGEIGAHLEGQMKLAATRAPKVRSGRLRNSIAYAFRGPMQLEVGVEPTVQRKTLAYAGIQEEGGTVNGRPWLAIPILAARNRGIVTEAGVGGIRARDVRANPGQFGFVSTFVQKSKRGNLIVFGSVGKGRIEPIFVLKSKVKIEGNRYIQGTYERERPRITKFLGDAIRRGVEAA